MSNTNIPKNNNLSKSFSRNDGSPIIFKRNSFQQRHSNSMQISTVESSPRTNLIPRYSFGSVNSGPSSYDPNRNPIAAEQQNMRNKTSAIKIKTVPSVPKSTGLIYSSNMQHDFSSIDKINDSNSHGLICAGKSHLGYYKFSEEDKSVKLVHSFLSTGTPNIIQNSAVASNLNKRHRQLKLSTMADVKTGFNEHKNLIGICGKSTTISIYDVNKAGSIDNPMITSYSEHTRAVNSIDFNMVQSNLLISGGQDGCIKIWDLRTGSLNNSTRSDININTASDSIRDVKWMPAYNFSGSNSLPSSSRQKNNAGYKFASIHDSGMLLKFDIRQPTYSERKINAHTGPGLCLNWHPNQDYIATGGRDGKCCLWYVGDLSNETTHMNNISSNIPSNSYSNVSMNANSVLALPETTINAGFPVTKLKFRPAFENNVMNSLLAISSMGDEAVVNVYSLGRKYIPKHVLLTAASSLGLVWWDDKTIFNIDRANRINGWNIEKEPTVLDNIQRTVVTWRDMDGSEFLTVNQNIGGYSTTEDYTPMIFDKIRNSGNKPRTIAQQEPNTTKGKIFDPFKKSLSGSNLSLNSDKASVTRQSNIKSFGYANPHNSHFGSEYVENKEVDSPLMITLDLPHILNNMRLSQMHLMKRKTIPSDISAIKESPIEVFQFLARELDFSFSKDRNTNTSTPLVKPMLHEENDMSQEDLMKKFGLSDTTTWTNLINKKSESESENKSLDKQTTVSDSNTSKHSRGDSSAKTSIFQSDKQSEIEDEETGVSETTKKLRDRINLLIELIEICKHNASVYSYIDDLPNFKVWVILRDALLWDLQTISNKLEIEETEVLEENSDKFQYNEHFNATQNNRNNSFTTQLTDLPSEIDSFVDNNPNATSQNDSSTLGQLFSKEKDQVIEGFKEVRRLEPIHSLSADSVPQNKTFKHNDDNLSKRKNLSEPIPVSIGTPELSVKESIKKPISSSSSAILEEEDESENPDSETSTSSDIQEQQGILITGRRTKRPSFIDTFMSERPVFERKESEVYNASSFSTHDNSPISKLSSFRNFSQFTPSLTNTKRLSQSKMPLSPTLSDGFSRISDFEPPKFKINSTNVKEQQAMLSKLFGNEKNNKNQQSSNEIAEPWSTAKIVKQLFNQAVQDGNILMVISLLTLFQDIYDITTFHIVKDSILQFIDILHRYELFEIAAALLKYCPWDKILENNGGNSLSQIFCDKCGKLVVNESSKEKFTQEDIEQFKNPGNKSAMKRFGYWYCESCQKKNSVCVLCERPMKGLTMSILECGHIGHFECMREWFLEEGMKDCPAGDFHNVN